MELPIRSASSCEVRSVIRFLSAKNVTASEIHRQICEVYGAGVMSVQMVRQWRREFIGGREEVHDRPREGRPKDSLTSDAIAGVRALLNDDILLTIRQMEQSMRHEMCNPVSRMTIDRIVKEELHFRKVCARWVPRELTTDHKNNRMAAAIEFLTRYQEEGEAMLDRIITGDETWVHHFTPSTKKQTMVWKTVDEPTPKKFKTVPSAGKVMCTVFWNAKGVILQEYLEPGTTITAERYCQTLHNLRKAIKNKRPGLLSKGVLLFHDNARPHSAKVTTDLLTAFKWDVFSHPAYSPDLAPSDFFLFPMLKTALGGMRFRNNAEVEEWTRDFFSKLDANSYSTGIRKLVPRYETCLNRFGDYVEK